LAWTCPGWQVPWEAAEGSDDFVSIPNTAPIGSVRAWHPAIFDHAQKERCADAKERGGLFHRKADWITRADDRGPFHNTISRSFSLKS
jgi:hypothetical protein